MPMARASNPPCSEHTYYGHPCGNNGKFERDGKWFCVTHDPERQRARDEARQEQWRQEREAREAARAKAERQRRDIERVVRGVAEAPHDWAERAQEAVAIVSPGLASVARAICAELDAERAP